MIDVSERDFLTIQRLLEKYVPDCDVWAFGSRATWTAKEHSDLDLVVVGQAKLKTGILESLKEDLDESALPFRVDILDWNRISAEFKRNIEKNYVVVKRAGRKIPEGWHYYKVSDFAEVIGGGTPKTEVAEYWNGNIPWVTPKDLSSHQARRIARGERNITQEGLKNSSARIVPADTVLLTSRAPVGYLAIAQNEVATNQGFRNLVVKEGFSPEFVYYLLLNNVDYLKQHASGSTFQELSGGTLKNLEFQIPKYATQKEIAKILGDLDEKIELNHQMNKTFEAIAQALFKQWFIEFKFPGHEKAKFINGLPEGWTYNEYLNELNIVYGKNLPTTNLKPSGYPVFGGNGLIGFYDKYLYEDAQVIIACRGAASGKVNQTLPHSFVTNNSLILEIPQKSPLRFSYLKQCCLSADFLSLVTGSAQPQLTIESIKGSQLLIPDAGIIKMFDSIVSPMEEYIRDADSQSVLLAQLRDSLLPKLMAGEVVSAGGVK